MRLFIQLSENDKRAIFILLLAIIIFLAVIGYIGYIIKRVMKFQGRRLDTLTRDVVITKVIDNKKDFVRYARKKNWRVFFLQSWIPLLILTFGISVLLIRNAATNDWSYNLLDYNKTGFNTIFWIWDFGNIDKYTTKVFGITLLANWPDIIHSPEWHAEAWASYIFFFSMLIGGIWYLVSLQCVVARTIRMYQLRHSIFDANLDGYNQRMAPDISVSHNDNDKTNLNI